MRLKDALGAISRGELSFQPLTEETRADRRVARGVKYLDQVFGRGTWEHKVFDRGLDIEFDDSCVFGKLTGSYNKELGAGGHLFLLNPVRCGFFEDEHVSFAALTAAWMRAGVERLREDFARQERHSGVPHLVAA